MIEAQTARPTPHLILGGAKSGKSLYAEQQISSLPGPYAYLATGQALDEEMKLRIQRHKERRGAQWETFEAPLHILEILEALQNKGKPALFDCLTLWLTNLLLQGDEEPEAAISRLTGFVTTCSYPLIIVSNEVGCGIVPENALARRFRDLAGAANQQLARACRSVSFVSAGIPLALK